jgi:hypothetical protein
MHRRWNLALAGLLALGSTECTGGLTTNTALVAGLYELRSVSDLPLPFLLDSTDADNQLALTAGEVNVLADGSFVDSTTFLVTEAGVAHDESEVASGRWSQKGNTISFTPGDGSGTYTMALAGDNRLIQQFGALALAYVR